MTATPVLIVGAGPTGLVMALSLARRGVRFRIVDAHEGPGEESRAMAVHARTLEFYRQFGFADAVVSEGICAKRIHLRRHDRNGANIETGSFGLGDLGKGLSPYPFLLTYPQDLHERFLLKKLAEIGVTVERGVSLEDFAESGDGVRAVLETNGVKSEVEAGYLAGCDGARSRVREVMGVGFSGGTYEQRFFVADVKIDGGFDPDVRINLGASGFALMLPVRATGMQRLIGIEPERLKGRSDIAFEDIRDEVEALIGVRVAEVHWFSTYRVHHRVADHFRRGRAFLSGDAGHLHSPAGGQGMNTGIGDAINLGWKLAHVVLGRAAPALLESYEAERIPFARRLVATTDRAFQAVVAEGFGGEFVRHWLAPAALGLASRFATTGRLAFRTVSQIAIAYPDSPLSEGEAGVRAGDRLPWVEDGGTDNFAPLASLDWQAHVYGPAADDLAAACAQRGLALHALLWSEAAEEAGLKRGAVYLVRPDGYVGFAATKDATGLLAGYVENHGLRFGAAG